MPQQLIYTSSPQGLVAGRSGYCTVACSDGLREALILSLEQVSCYEHHTSDNSQLPAVCAHRILDIRGGRYHVLSRIVDAGLDFTKRTNFIAHHLVFEPHEVASLPAPPVLLLRWNGWRDRWQGDPQLLRDEFWGNLFSLTGPSFNPARNWAGLTGDAVNAVALLDCRSPESWLADNLTPEQTLTLLAESLALLPVRPALGNTWQQTFTTFLQEQDDLAAFRWRMVYIGTAAHNRLLARGGEIKTLASLRCGAIDDLTAAFARSGPQPLQITVQPEDRKLSGGQPLLLKVVARGIPAPSQYQWYACSRDGRRQPVPGAVTSELRVPLLPNGVSRYLVVVGDGCGGTVESRVAVIQVDRDFGTPDRGNRPAPTKSPAKLTLVRGDDDELTVKPKGARGWTEADTAADEAWQAAEAKENKKTRTTLLIWAGVIVFLIALSALGYELYRAWYAGTVSGTADNATQTNVNSSAGSSAADTNKGSTSNSTANTTNSKPKSTDQPGNQNATMKMALVFLLPNVELAIEDENKNLHSIQNAIEDAKNKMKDLENQLNQLKPGKDAGPASELRNQITEYMNQIPQYETSQNNLTTHIHQLEHKNTDQKDRAKQEISLKLKELFPYPNNGQIFLQTTDLLLMQTNPPVPWTGAFDVRFGDTHFILSADTNQLFSVTNIEVQNNRLNNPLLITISTDPVPSNLPLAKLFVWPTTISPSATCDEQGNLVIANGTSLFAALTELKQVGKYNFDFNVAYGTRTRPNYYSTNFEILTNATYAFATLPGKLKLWEHALAAVTNFMVLESQNDLHINGTNVWDEVDAICTNLTRSTYSYNFRTNYQQACTNVFQDLQADKNTNQLVTALAEVNLNALAMFCQGEKSAVSLDRAKSLLQNLLPFAPGKLSSTITSKDGVLAKISFQ